MPQPEPSVSDSISYLRTFLNTSDSTLDRQSADGTLPTQPPAALPASFLPRGLRISQPTPATYPGFSSASRRSPPSTISVLSHRSSAQQSAVDNGAPNPPYAAAAGSSFTHRSNSAPHTPLFRQPQRISGLSSLRTEEGGVPEQGIGSHNTYVDAGEAASFSDSIASKENTWASHNGGSGMFRYGSAPVHSSDGGWRSASAASRRPLTGLRGNESLAEPKTGQRTGALWTQPPSLFGISSHQQQQQQQQQQQHQRTSLLSSSSSYERAALRAEERFPWRRNTAAPPTHQGSSLLWGWGSDAGGVSGGGGPAVAVSPSPYEPSPYTNRSPSLSLPQQRNSTPYGGASTGQQREAAYEEVEERRAPATSQLLKPSHVNRASNTASPPDHHRRHPPLPPLPSPSPRSAGTVKLTMCHNPDEHAVNMRSIAHYLKDYYAREADEMERGVESLTAEDVAGLAQCFYIDLYRSVRQARRSAGLDTSSFVAEDPTENVIADVAPPHPQREEHRHVHPPPASSSPPASTQKPLHTDSQTTASPKGAEVENEAFTESEGNREGHHNASRHAWSGQNPAEEPTARYGERVAPLSRSPPRAQNPLLSSPEDKLLSSPAATTRLAPNQQLAYSGGGTHHVQIVTARLPAFRNDDTLSDSFAETQSSRQLQRSVPGKSPQTLGARSVQHRHSPSFTYQHARDRDSAADAASLSALATTPSPPYRHLPPAVQQQSFPSAQPFLARTDCPAVMPLASANASRHVDVNCTRSPPRVTKAADSSHLTQLRTRNSSHHVQARPRFQSASSYHRHGSNNSSSGDSDGENTTKNEEGTLNTAEGSEGESSAGQRGRLHRAAPSEPSSGIVKRPLKELMPLLRSHGTLIVKHVHQDHLPHLRLFQVLDCIDAFRGKEVLMPHFTWACAEGVTRHDRPPRPKKTRKGVPLPTGLSLSQQEMPYETALNLTTLEAVYVGAGRGISAEHMDLFHRRRRDGVVLDHMRRPVANGMCAVFVFASGPVAVTFLREDDRQVWVGAMMGVVERNRTLAA